MSKRYYEQKRFIEDQLPVLLKRIEAQRGTKSNGG